MPVIGAVTGDFAVLFATRVVAAVANAGFLAVAMSVAGARDVALAEEVRALAERGRVTRRYGLRPTAPTMH